MKVKPLGSKILVSPLPQEDKTASGIFLAERYKPEQQVYLVLAVGPGRLLPNGNRVLPEIDPGQRVLIDQYSIQSKVEAGPNQFLIDSSAVALVTP